ncbi:hypothetical protein N0V94_005341 [Neodidymelliopsis sp. IMI 364377]|nr:hypothetical protein N0V94_005341 [Neodidymelliopsis sp. IMI 364377]
MIIPGRTALFRKVITRLLSPKHQVQPCGVDLTLKRILTWTSPGFIDFTNTRRKTADTAELPFQLPPTSTQTSPDDRNTDFVDLPHGSYLVEFNETVDMPLDLMGQIFVRSSLFRSGG